MYDPRGIQHLLHAIQVSPGNAGVTVCIILWYRLRTSLVQFASHQHDLVDFGGAVIAVSAMARVVFTASSLLAA